MTESIEADVTLEGAERLVHQHAPEIPQLSARTSFVATDRDHAGTLDTVAGCEYLDDRIRLTE